MRDFDLAEKLLEVLEYLDKRAVRRFGGNRRHDSIAFIAARQRMEARKQEWQKVVSSPTADDEH